MQNKIWDNSGANKTTTDVERATIMKRHMLKLIQQLRNEKINAVLSRIIDVKEDEGDLVFESFRTKSNSTLTAEEYDILLRKKKQAERDTVFKVQQLLVKCSAILENQVTFIDQAEQEKHRKQNDELSHIIRGQASTIQILQQKLDRWREAKKKQNKIVLELQEKLAKLQTTFKINQIELDKLNSKNERIESIHKYSSGKLGEKDAKIHELSGYVALLKMQLNSAKTKLRQSEEAAGTNNAELVKQAESFKAIYAELVANSAQQLNECKKKAEHEYNELADSLTRERQLRVHNEAQQSIYLGELEIKVEDLQKQNNDLQVDVVELREKIADLEHTIRYSKIQRRFSLSLEQLRMKKIEEENKKVEIKVIPPPPSTTTTTNPVNLLELVGKKVSEKDSVPATNPETNESDGDSHQFPEKYQMSEDSSLDEFEYHNRDNNERYEKISMKVKPTCGIVGSSELYIKTLKYYRPATKSPTIESIQEMLCKNIIQSARAREKKYVWGWEYFVRQYKMLVYFKTLSKTGNKVTNNDRVLSALSYGRLNARMAKRQWRKLRYKTHENTNVWWNSILNGCVKLTNEINDITLPCPTLFKRKQKKWLKANIDGNDDLHVGLDDVVLDKKTDPMAHFDFRIVSDAKPTNSAGITRPHTAGQTRSKGYTRVSNVRTSNHSIKKTKAQSPRPPFVAPKRPSTARFRPSRVSRNRFL
jgi:hypothetical protein